MDKQKVEMFQKSVAGSRTSENQMINIVGNIHNSVGNSTGENTTTKSDQSQIKDVGIYGQETKQMRIETSAAGILDQTTIDFLPSSQIAEPSSANKLEPSANLIDNSIVFPSSINGSYLDILQKNTELNFITYMLDTFN